MASRAWLPMDQSCDRSLPARVMKLDRKAMTSEFKAGIVIPLKPFFCSMGVAPAVGRVSSTPPGTHAGNLDNKDLVAGTTLYIPVFVPGALFDFGLYFFHNARELTARGSGPYFYVPKLEGHHEARLWNDVFVRAQAALDVPRGTIRATVLIETIVAAFEMDEILYELREHAAGLNAGR